MLLYVDETESPEYFIVTGLLVSKKETELAYKRFRKKAKSIKVSQKQKSILFTEFKSTLLDNDYQSLKVQMLTELNRFPYCVIYSGSIKKNKLFSQKIKERTYINLLSRILVSITVECDVIFDSFNKKDFESEIIKKLTSFPHVCSAKSADSQTIEGLKFVDNICSVIRLHKTGRDENSFYQLIKDRVNEV